MAAPRSMARVAIFSSACMPFRLDRLRTLEECRSLLAGLDPSGPADPDAITAPAAPVEAMNDDELLAELEGAAGSSDLTQLRHVRSAVQKREAEEIATRERCADFEMFKPLFEHVQKDLSSGPSYNAAVCKRCWTLQS